MRASPLLSCNLFLHRAAPREGCSAMQHNATICSRMQNIAKPFKTMQCKIINSSTLQPYNWFKLNFNAIHFVAFQICNATRLKSNATAHYIMLKIRKCMIAVQHCWATTNPLKLCCVQSFTIDRCCVQSISLVLCAKYKP